MFVEGKQIPTELKKDEAELKNDVLYDDVERDGELFMNIGSLDDHFRWEKKVCQLPCHNKISKVTRLFPSPNV